MAFNNRGSGLPLLVNQHDAGGVTKALLYQPSGVFDAPRVEE